MHFKELDRGELIAAIGGIALGLSLFLHWYDLGNIHATLSMCKGPNTSCTGWKAMPVGRYIVLAAAVAPLILAYIIVRGHALSWPRGELTAVVALIVLMVTLFVGVLDKPGNPRSEISVSYGWWLAVLGGLLLLLGSIWRTSESAAQRKPPGVL
jgi:hypothetical protein